MVCQVGRQTPHDVCVYVCMYVCMYVAMNCDEEYKRVFELLVKYLDYPCNRFQPQPWVLLHKVQSMWYVRVCMRVCVRVCVCYELLILPLGLTMKQMKCGEGHCPGGSTYLSGDSDIIINSYLRSITIILI